MFEHVGVGHYRDVSSARSASCSTDDGVALHPLHRPLGRPDATNPLIGKYIFPGGYIPALSRVAAGVEKLGLSSPTSRSCACTTPRRCAPGASASVANRDEVAAIYDERFCRMWEFYLAGSEVAFRYQDLMIFQLQLAKRIDALPLTRDYMLEAERWLAVRDERPIERPRIAGE